jgi:hypothetical protein
MLRTLVIVAAIVLVAALGILIVPMWLSVARFGLPVAGWAPVALTVLLCFGIGGGLMALIFVSSRRGYDEAAHEAALDLDSTVDSAAEPRAASAATSKRATGVPAPATLSDRSDDRPGPSRFEPPSA